MANLQLIKDIATAKKITIEELASRVGINSQAIHVMARTGSTRIETLEKIASVLEVPAYIFMDYKFDFTEYQREVILGGKNAFNYFGTQTNYFGENGSHIELLKAKDEVIATKDEIIGILKEKIAALEKKN